MVQIGGVWTPPEGRSRGYGRCVVAGALQMAISDGVDRSILFTEPDNVGARRAYRAIGFRPIGTYGVVFFR